MSALSYKQLCQLLDCKQAASVRRQLKKLGVRWSKDRNGKPWTTEAELNRALFPPRTLTFTKPVCRKNLSHPASGKSTARGTSSRSTNGPSYVG